MKRTPVLESSAEAREATIRGARLDSLTGIRWFATLGVFLSHVGILMPLPHARGLFSLGESGVSLFFVLSGFVLFFALLVAALAQQDLSGGPSFLRGRPLVRLGQWSYAFYLFQFTVLLPLALAANPGRQVADFFTDPLAPKASYTGYAVLALAITVAVSAFFYRFVEHPLERRLRHRLRTPPEPAHHRVPPPEPSDDPTPSKGIA
ncbi:hypothetical protein AB0399_36275 [Streptomyces sp. NPDC088194]|uniref:acyltransferase family protein n=1 Tax=Streptomyces sp. NPDC088194 TaxID=3154931 RepID=UPI00344B8538